jgi:hypothetical protein
MNKKEKLEELSSLYLLDHPEEEYHCYNEPLDLDQLDIVKNNKSRRTACYSGLNHEKECYNLSILYSKEACIFNKEIIADYMSILKNISIELGFNKNNFDKISDNDNMNYENFIFYLIKDIKNVHKKNLFLLTCFRYCWENKFRNIFCIYMILYYLTKYKKYNKINNINYLFYFATYFNRKTVSGGHGLYDSNIQHLKRIPNSTLNMWDKLDIDYTSINSASIIDSNKILILNDDLTKDKLIQHITNRDYDKILKMYLSFIQLNNLKE